MYLYMLSIYICLQLTVKSVIFCNGSLHYIAPSHVDAFFFFVLYNGLMDLSFGSPITSIAGYNASKYYFYYI